MSSSKKFSSGCCCKRASSIGSGGSGSSGGSGGGSDGLWTLINGKVSTILGRPVRVENTISSVVLEIDSDKRLKTDIESVETTCVDSLFNNVSPKKFAYKKTPDDTHYGFIAQDIKKAGSIAVVDTILKFLSDNTIPKYCPNVGDPCLISNEIS